MYLWIIQNCMRLLIKVKILRQNKTMETTHKINIQSKVSCYPDARNTKMNKLVPLLKQYLDQ